MYRIRLAGPEDHAVQRELLVERLPGADLDKRLAWAYYGTPYGDALVWIAYHGETGEPAGLTTFFRRKMWVEGQEMGGALGGDMYVRPSHRRRGIGKQLFLAARADMEKVGVKIMFGTPMPPNVTPLLSSGSSVPKAAVVRCARILRSTGEKMRWLPRPVGSLLDPILQPRPRAGMRLDPVTGTDPRIDALWKETRAELTIAVVRDAEFYRWRFVDSPSQKQRPYVVVKDDRPVAACALEEVGDKLRIVDLVAPATRWREAILAIAGTTGLAGMEMRLGTADAERRRVWTSGLLQRETAPMSMLTSEGSPLESRVHDPDRWFLTWADTDIDHV